MGEQVRVVFRKYDGSLHWHLTVRRLGQDEHGVWVGSPAGGVMRKGNGPDVRVPHSHVGLIPPDAWWTAWFNAEPERVEIYCDVITPPRWTSASEVEMIDLDLDVCRMRADGTVHLLDEDEFAEHQLLYGYTADVLESAARAASWLQTAMAPGGDEPFRSRYRTWLAKVPSRG